MFLVLLLYALFASVFTLAKTGLEFSQPFFLVGSRMFVAGLLLLGYQFCFHREKLVIRKQDWGRLLRLSLFNIYLTNVLEFWGLQYLTSFKTCFIYSLSPFLSALFCYLLFTEKLSMKKWAGFLIGFLGFLPILLSETTHEEQAGHLLFFSWAEIAVMGAVGCSVYGWILLGQLVKDNGISPLVANGVSMTIGGALALIHSFFAENWNPLPVTNYFSFLECALLLMLISNLIAYNLYGFLLRRFTATFISFAGFSTPLFTAILGWFFLGEVVTVPFYVSAIVVFTGLTIFYQEELKQGYRMATTQPSLEPVG